MSYVRQRWRGLLSPLTVLLLFNLYFFFFIQDRKTAYLVYLDVVFLVSFLAVTGIDYLSFTKNQKEKQQLMGQKELICRAIPSFENQDIAEHDVRVLEEQIHRQFGENCDLQDFVAKWCHEFKIPLAAGLLMNEKILDGELRMAMREQLERMNRQVNFMLLGCRLQSSVLDIQVKRTLLSECVKASLRNNRFFLVQRGFELKIDTDDTAVYTDPSWIVYVLDQLISNAVKYGRKQGENGDVKEAPVLSVWTEKGKDEARLFVEDRGEGIRERDIRRIFEKGFTGSSYHNGKYKSTGMGLYMVSKIIDRLGHRIEAESEYGKYTRFCIVFQENGYHLRGQDERSSL